MFSTGKPSTYSKTFSSGKQFSDNKDLTYFGLSLENLSEVMQFFKKFYVPLHPLYTGIHATFEDVKDILEHMTSETLKLNMSFGIRNYEGELVGLIMADIHGYLDSFFDDFFQKYSKENKKIELLMKTCETITKKFASSIIADFDEKSEMIHTSRFILHPDYCSILYFSNLMDLVEQKALEKGVKYVRSFCAGRLSRKAAEMRGYKLIFESKFDEYDCCLDLEAIGESKGFLFGERGFFFLFKTLA